MKREISEMMKYEICEDVVDALEKFGKDNVKKNLREMDDEDVRYLRVDFSNTIMDVFEYELDQGNEIDRERYETYKKGLHFVELELLDRRDSSVYPGKSAMAEYPVNLVYMLFEGQDGAIQYLADVCGKLVELLSEKEQEVIRYRFEQRLTKKEVAERMGMTEDDVLTIEAKSVRKLGSFLKRGMLKLRREQIRDKRIRELENRKVVAEREQNEDEI